MSPFGSYDKCTYKKHNSMSLQLSDVLTGKHYCWD